MSGFAGFLSTGDSIADRTWLDAAMDLLAGRGPDGAGVHLDEDAGLGHRLFRTRDDEPDPPQPLALDGDVWVVADARIDARDELRRRLSAEGRLRQRSLERSRPGDAELILHAYDVWGRRCVERLLGDFTFAVLDRRTREVFLARDPLGVKPLYYALPPGGRPGIVFSNTLDCVRAHQFVSAELDEGSVADFLLTSFVQDPEATVFRDVRRLAPGHSLTLKRGSAAPRLERYWDLPDPPTLRYRREEEYVERFKDLFDAAVSDRLRTRRAGVFMSGGLDSPGIAAAARRKLENDGQPYDLRAYTGYYEDLMEDDEREYADLAARHLSIPIEFIRMDDYSLFEGWGEPGFRRPQPYDEPALASWVALSGAAARHARVAFYGEDPESVLFPLTLRTMLRSERRDLAARVLRYTARHRRLPYLGTGVLAALRGEEPASPNPEAPPWLEPEFARRTSAADRYRAWVKAQCEVPLGRYAQTRKRLLSAQWQSLLEQLDPGVSGLPLEIRLPFLDLRLVEFMLSVPTVPWAQRKELLRKAFRDDLPAEIIARPKTPLDGYYEAELARADGLEETYGRLVGAGLREYVEMAVAARVWKDPSTRSWRDLRPMSLGRWLAEQRREENYSLQAAS